MTKVKCDNCGKPKSDFSGLKSEGNWKNICVDCDHEANPTDYNGWKNYETWNVALWIGNGDGLYSEAKRFKHKGYRHFVESLKELGGEISIQTPDGVAWNDSGLDIDALDDMLGEL